MSHDLGEGREGADGRCMCERQPEVVSDSGLLSTRDSQHGRCRGRPACPPGLTGCTRDIPSNMGGCNWRPEPSRERCQLSTGVMGSSQNEKIVFSREIK